MITVFYLNLILLSTQTPPFPNTHAHTRHLFIHTCPLVYLSTRSNTCDTYCPSLVQTDVTDTQLLIAIPAAAHTAVKTNDYVPFTFTNRDSSASLVNKEVCEHAEEEESGVKHRLPRAKLHGLSEQYPLSDSWNAGTDRYHNLVKLYHSKQADAWDNHLRCVHRLRTNETGRWEITHTYNLLVLEKAADCTEYNISLQDEGALGRVRTEYNNRHATSLAQSMAQGAVRKALAGISIQ